MLLEDRPTTWLEEKPGEMEPRLVSSRGPVSVTARLTGWGPDGCLVAEILLVCRDRSAWRLTSSRLAATIGYLDGGLTLVKTPLDRSLDVLRSAPRNAAEGVTSFFEIVICPSGGWLKLTHLETDPASGMSRQAPAAMSLTVLTRLVEDLARLAA